MQGEGTLYGNLGVLFRSLGEYQKAKEYHEKALAIATQIGDRKEEGKLYGNLGLVFRSLGEYQKAKETIFLYSKTFIDQACSVKKAEY